jgi:hypothetical protein
MKRNLILTSVLGVFVLPLLAQVDHDYNPNDRVPLVNVTITKDQVPAAVVKAVNTQFDKTDPLTWSSFHMRLKNTVGFMI